MASPHLASTIQGGPAPQGGGSLYVRVIEGEASWIYHLPSDGVVLAGRAEEAGLRLGDASVSRHHSRITVAQWDVTIADLGSRNGTIVNGERVAEGSRALGAGDVVSLGEVILVLHRLTGTDAASRITDLQQLRGRVGEEIERSLTPERPFTLLGLALGGPARDRVALASLVQSELRRIDHAAWESDVHLFALLPEQGGDAARDAARRILQAVHALAPTARAGCARFPIDGCVPDALFGAARAAALAAGAGEVVDASALSHRIGLGDRSVVVADAAMTHAFRRIEKLAASDGPLLILGETGVGKENAAYAVHVHSSRGGRPFVALNCAAIPETLAEAELFGSVRGGYTEARDRPGPFERAEGGTVFLDEIAELPLSLQAMLLRVLETRRVQRVGDVRERDVDFRLVAATNRNLDPAMEEGRFRKDLFYRLGARVFLPPLRERPQDIPVLTRLFVADACSGTRNRAERAVSISAAAMHRLAMHDWPGNVRELKAVVDAAVAEVEGNVLEPWHLPRELDPPPRPAPVSAAIVPRRDDQPLAGWLEELERREILEALERTGWNQSEAARLLRMPRRTLVFKLRRHQLPENRGRP